MYMWGVPSMGVSKNGRVIRENSIKLIKNGWFAGTPILGNPHLYYILKILQQQPKLELQCFRNTVQETNCQEMTGYIFLDEGWKKTFHQRVMSYHSVVTPISFSSDFPRQTGLHTEGYDLHAYPMKCSCSIMFIPHSTSMFYGINGNSRILKWTYCTI